MSDPVEDAVVQAVVDLIRTRHPSLVSHLEEGIRRGYPRKVIEGTIIISTEGHPLTRTSLLILLDQLYKESQP